MDMACARSAAEAKARGVMGPFSPRICESAAPFRDRHFVRNASRRPRFHGLPDSFATASQQVRAARRSSPRLGKVNRDPKDNPPHPTLHFDLTRWPAFDVHRARFWPAGFAVSFEARRLGCAASLRRASRLAVGLDGSRFGSEPKNSNSVF